MIYKSKPDDVTAVSPIATRRGGVGLHQFPASGLFQGKSGPAKKSVKFQTTVVGLLL